MLKFFSKYYWFLALTTLLTLNLFGVEKAPVLDDDIWLNGGAQFAHAILSGDFSSTRVTTKPGVSIMWISGTISIISGAFNTGAIDSKLNTFLNYLAFTLISFSFFIIWVKLLGKQGIPLVFALIMNPFLADKTALAWTDRILIYSIFTTVLFFWKYLETKKKLYAILAGIFFGIGLLTKVSGLVLVPTFILISAAIYSRKLFKNFIGSLVTFLTGVSVFYVFYPAAWTKPYLLFDRVREINYADTNNSLIDSLKIYTNMTLTNEPVLVACIFLTILFMFRYRVWPNYKIWSIALYLLYTLIVLALTSRYKDLVVISISSFRYFAVAIPFMFGFIYYIYLEIRNQLSRKMQNLISLLYIAIVLSYSVIAILNLYRDFAVYI